MYEYMTGLVTEINSTYIVLECQKIGYLIYTANPYAYHPLEEYKLYLYDNVDHDGNHLLFGFKTKDEKDLFLKLINVKGVGCKTVLPMFATGSTAGIKDAIERENILYLKKFPKIGDKVARQIILDLKGKLVAPTETITDVTFEELTGALKGLGYKDSDIKRILPKIDAHKSIEEQIKDALRLMLR